MRRWRVILALLTGKSILRVLRWMRRSGTTLPGAVALRVAPNLIEALAASARRARVVVTGTNGKTTTAALWAGIMESGGWQVVRNTSGANLQTGLATALLERAPLSGAWEMDVCLAEVDEATMPLVTPDLKPAVTVITNFFRDQLDRYGELDRIVRRVGDSLQHVQGIVCLNADDPLVVGLAERLPDGVTPMFFGFATSEMTSGEGVVPSGAVDVQFCPRCGTRFHYHAVMYGHLGDYECPSCGFARPLPEISGRLLQADGMRGLTLELTLGSDAAPQIVELQLPGRYNAYNALAAAAGAHALGFPAREIQAGLEHFSGAFGRMETVVLPEGQVTLALVKNPIGFDQVLASVTEDRRARVLALAINDRFADGTDISWLWDVDFERIADADVNFLVSGRRAEDMAVRLKYAGVSADRIAAPVPLDRLLIRALEAAEGEGEVYVLCTYTAMLALREALIRQGRVKEMWQS